MKGYINTSWWQLP